MKQILIFAGTTEGRQLIERLCQYRIQIHVCVATEYGSTASKQTNYHSRTTYEWYANESFFGRTCI